MARQVTSLKIWAMVQSVPLKLAAGQRIALALATTTGLLTSILVGNVAAETMTQTGTITIEQVQIAFIGSGNLGGGHLSYGGKSYSFTIGGLGIGGFGISKMTAVGEVYDLHKLADFSGAYVQARYGMAIGQSGGGELWLQNTSGVVLHLKTERKGLALSLGGDAVYIDFD